MIDVQFQNMMLRVLTISFTHNGELISKGLF